MTPTRPAGDSGSPCAHLGAVVYLWGEAEQSRLVTHCLAAFADELRSRGLRAFWFDRFDARGPHVFALWSLPPQRLSEARDTLGRRLERYLAAHPASARLPDSELAARHAACRNKTLCAADTLPGMARPGTYLVFEQPETAYPLQLLRRAPQPRALAASVDELTRWVVERMTAAAPEIPSQAAMRWIASLDATLAEDDVAAERYWRYHASTLLPGLAARLDAGEPVAHRLVSARNHSTFTRVWARTPAGWWPGWPRLLELLAFGSGSTRESHLLLREILHTSLKQLGLPVKLQIPLVCFAWSRHLGLATPGRGSPGS